MVSSICYLAKASTSSKISFCLTPFTFQQKLNFIHTAHCLAWLHTRLFHAIYLHVYLYEDAWWFLSLTNAWWFLSLENAWWFLSLENEWWFSSLRNAWWFLSLENEWWVFENACWVLSLENAWRFLSLENVWWLIPGYKNIFFIPVPWLMHGSTMHFNAYCIPSK